MRVDLKTKYCKITVHEELYDNDPIYWMVVTFYCSQKDDPVAVMFGMTMDLRLEKEAKSILRDFLGNGQVRLEDGSLLIDLTPHNKQFSAQIFGLVERLEKEFDALIERGRNLS